MIMHTFEWVEAALGVIIALSLTRLVVSIANMLIARRQVTLDWIPFAWAVSIFFLLVQFSWNFVHIGALIKTWSFLMFILLLVFVFNLFVAATLILPNAESQSEGDLTDWYAYNGRWAMPFIALYALLTEPFYWYFLNITPLQNPAAIVIIIAAMIALFTSSRTILAYATTAACLAVGGLMIQMAINQ